MYYSVILYGNSLSLLFIVECFISTNFIVVIKVIVFKLINDILLSKVSSDYCGLTCLNNMLYLIIVYIGKVTYIEAIFGTVIHVIVELVFVFYDCARLKIIKLIAISIDFVGVIQVLRVIEPTKAATRQGRTSCKASYCDSGTPSAEDCPA